MATLHVRNFPDDLYELLRERAGANDRSIGAETVQLLQERLALVSAGRPPRRSPIPGRRRSPGSGLFTRFTPEARQAVVGAQEEARELGHDHVGTEHLLLGVLRGGESAAAAGALQTLGLTYERARAEVEKLGGRGETHPTGQIPFQPGAKKALELALREALAMRDESITPEHMLIGLVAEETGRGAEIVRAVEPDAAKLRAAMLGGRLEPPRPGFWRAPAFRVFQLEGVAVAWEAQLNDAATHGYELIEIVDGRVILRRT